jgi:phage-related protein
LVGVAKSIIWIGSSLEDIRGFPEEARRSAGFQLRRVQEGLDPNDWKPMPAVAPGVQEIRVHTSGEHRVLCVARFAESVYVLHAFEKKTQRTAKHDLELARKRYGDLTQIRKDRHGKR